MNRYALLGALLVGICGCSSTDKSTQEKKAPTSAAVPEVFRVNFDTTKGPFVLEVTRSWAPKGADRFHRLVTDKFYDGARFYRVRPDFVVQWGISKDPKMNELWKQLRLKDDPVTQSNVRGTIAFATDGPDTRTTEVFINLVDNARLDARGFAPFGRVIEGMETVDSFFAGYGEVVPRGSGVDPNKYMTEGDRYIERAFPNLDGIISARIVQ